ncbi:pleckstrin homology domain-containing family H member 1-like [Lampetra planeri]
MAESAAREHEPQDEQALDDSAMSPDDVEQGASAVVVEPTGADGGGGGGGGGPGDRDGSRGAGDGPPACPAAWQERCLSLEAQLSRFRTQASKIRQLLADKMGELDRRVLEADRRADEAEQQVRVLEEKLRATSSPSHSGGRGDGPCPRCPSLLDLLHQKEIALAGLESDLHQQKQIRAQETKMIEEKAAKIKEWVTLKLRELEFENQALRAANQKQQEQIQSLQATKTLLAMMEEDGDDDIDGDDDADAESGEPRRNADSVELAVSESRSFLPSASGQSPGRASVTSAWEPRFRHPAHDDGGVVVRQAEQTLVAPETREQLRPYARAAGVAASSPPRRPCTAPPVPPLSPAFPPQPIATVRDATPTPASAAGPALAGFGGASDGDAAALELSPSRVSALSLTPPSFSSSSFSSFSSSSNSACGPTSGPANSNSVCDAGSESTTGNADDGRDGQRHGDKDGGISRRPHQDTRPVCTTLPKVRAAAEGIAQRACGTDEDSAERRSEFALRRHIRSQPPIRARFETEIDTDEEDDEDDDDTEGETVADENGDGRCTAETQREEESDGMETDDGEGVAVVGQVASTPAPPTPPLHRLPSWESRIYAIAKSGLRMSGSGSAGAESVVPAGRAVSSPVAWASSNPFRNFIYNSVTAPVYAMLKGKATELSASPLSPERASCSDEDGSSSCASSRASASEPPSSAPPAPPPGPPPLPPQTPTVAAQPSTAAARKGSGPGSPRAVKRGVSMSSISSESDYAIPPDACWADSDHSEPEHKLLKTCSARSSDSARAETLEKSGYLLKLGGQVPAWKRRWFVLRGGELLYYKSPSDVIRKPQGQVELNACCRVVRGDEAQMMQLVTEKRVMFLAADSPNLLEEWVRALHAVLHVQAARPGLVWPHLKPCAHGWLTKVKHGYSKRVWCALVGKVFYYFRSQEDKMPLGQLNVRGARVEEVDRSCDSDEDYEVTSARRSVAAPPHLTLCVQPRDQGPTYLLIAGRHEKDTWLYHLTVAAGSTSGKVGTEYEQLVGQLMDMDGDPSSLLWQHPTLCFSKEGIARPLTTLPSQALHTEAVKLFKSCQLFINVLIDAPAIDYHVSLAQSVLQVCISHPELHNEMYGQLIKQTSRRQPLNHYSLLQAWQLLALAVSLFLPQHRFLWYLKQHLHRHADPRSEVGKYAAYCGRCVERTLRAGDRVARPSRVEILSLLLRNPFHHSLPFSIPVHLASGAYQVVGFDGSSTVEEFEATLATAVGVRHSRLSGFALYIDDPSGHSTLHCLHAAVKVCDVISRWEQALKGHQAGPHEAARTVRLTYKNRLYYRSRWRDESERERVLLAHQVSAEVASGRFPASRALALEMAALMAQVEYGDLEWPTSALASSSPPQHATNQMLAQALDRFYPQHYRAGSGPEQLRQLCNSLATRWSGLHGRSAPDCARIFLTVVRKWPFFGATLFSAKPVLPSLLGEGAVWLAVKEDGVSILQGPAMRLLAGYPYRSVMSFGGCGDDFMLVVESASIPCRQGDVPSPQRARPPTHKLLFRMPSPKILEITLLVASYANSRQNQQQGFQHAGVSALQPVGFATLQQGEAKGPVPVASAHTPAAGGRPQQLPHSPQRPLPQSPQRPLPTSPLRAQPIFTAAPGGNSTDKRRAVPAGPATLPRAMKGPTVL